MRTAVILRRENRTDPGRSNTAMAKSKKKTSESKMSAAARRPLKKNANGVVMLSGGNPQVAKADGDAPVQHYIDNMPGWKSEQGRKLDKLITRHVRGVRKAVKWNSPFYGVEGKGWFLSFHVFARYIKVAFFRGQGLEPPLPVTSKDPHTRYVHIEERGFDEKQMADWVKQAAAKPGWMA